MTWQISYTNLQTQNPHLINIFMYLILQELRGQCTKFATSLLDHTRSSTELEILLNHDPTGPVYQHGDRMHLNRLKLAIKYRQKKVGIIIELFDLIIERKTQDVKNSL